MSDYNDYTRLVHQMQSFRASDEAREQFVSVRRSVLMGRVLPRSQRLNPTLPTNHGANRKS